MHDCQLHNVCGYYYIYLMKGPHHNNITLYKIISCNIYAWYHDGSPPVWPCVFSHSCNLAVVELSFIDQSILPHISTPSMHHPLMEVTLHAFGYKS
jgi:hypothetical protein